MTVDSIFGETFENLVEMATSPQHSIDFINLEHGDDSFKIRFKEKGKDIVEEIEVSKQN